MTPCAFRFGPDDRDMHRLPEMIAELRAGRYVAEAPDDGTWDQDRGRTMLVHAELPSISFSSALCSRPMPDGAVAAALTCLEAPLGSETREILLDALMRIVATTCSATALRGGFALVHAPTPWSALRIEHTYGTRGRKDVPADGERADRIPVCVHARWMTQPVGGRMHRMYAIEPFHVAVKESWRPDPLHTIRTLMLVDEDRWEGKP